jgi:hypothetical protein
MALPSAMIVWVAIYVFLSFARNWARLLHQGIAMASPLQDAWLDAARVVRHLVGGQVRQQQFVQRTPIPTVAAGCALHTTARTYHRYGVLCTSHGRGSVAQVGTDRS